MAGNPVTKNDWAYLAGFVDADGTIALNRWREKCTNRWCYLLRLCVSNCDKNIMNWLVSKLGGGVYLCNQNAPKHHRTLWRWVLCGTNARPVIEKILPFMLIKQKHAELALQYIKTIDRKRNRIPPEIKEQREHIFKHLARMNQRGRQR